MLPAVCVKETNTEKGRGVFALRAFRAGEIVEVSPVMPVRAHYEKLPEGFCSSGVPKLS